MRGVLLQAGAFLAGWAAWTLAEYLLHRFAFHRPRPGPLLGLRHAGHHARMEDRAVLHAAPIAPAVALSLLLLGLVGAFGWGTGGPAFLGFAAGYLAYEALHRAIHLHPARLPRRWVGYHLSHHLRRPHARFGVTTRIWDRVFGTYRDQ